jgi:hypothetical protein
MHKILYLIFLLRGCAMPALAQWTPEMEQFASYTEKQYELPKGLCRAFALKESNYQPFAERVEANYVEKTGTYAKNIRAAAYKFARERHWQPSFLTEVYNRGKSITLFQIMGQNMRDMGYSQPYLNYVSLNDQFDYFGKFIQPLVKKHKGNIAAVASEYNGGYGAVKYKATHGVYRNQAYVDGLLRNLQRFGN